jgi:HEAT repeat protein
MPQHGKRVARFAALPATAGILIGLFILHPPSIASWNQGPHLKFGQSLSTEAASGVARSYRISPLKSSLIYELLVSGKQPGGWADSAILNVKLRLPGGQEIHKALNSGDPDMYFMFQPSAAGAGTLEILADGAQQPLPFEIHLQRLPIGAKDFTYVGRKPAQRWKEAREMQLGRTVFAADDEIEYLDNRQEGKSGLDWYRFEYQGPGPKLVMFDVDVLDRDVPVNIRIYKQTAGPHGPAIEEYSEGKDPQEILHDMQKEIESKFITRVIQPGKYYVEVKANHPAYQLRTTLRDVPPYKDPREAAQTAMDYMIAEADSWFAHTPRGGSRQTRVENVTDETERCVACHAGHFTMRSSLEAVKNGYPVEMRPEFKFMMDKLYNAMAPLYGLQHVNWLRFDLAPGDGIGRIARMILYYENYFSHRPTSRPADAGGYLELVYKGRTQLPPNEFDGNRPVPRAKVAGDAWYDLNQLYQRTGRSDYKASRDKIQSLMLSIEPKDMEGICEQTIAMAEIGDPSFSAQIRKNVQKIFAAQHDDGSWWTPAYAHSGGYDSKLGRLDTPAAPEEKSDPGRQFMAGEAVYALVKAGVPASDPHIQKTLHYLLPLQKNFGAWLDNDGELFLTPFLETMWALKALSTVYPVSPHPAHAPTAAVSFNPKDATLVETLNWLDTLWDVHDAAVTQSVIPLLSSPYVIERQAAAAALGKMAVDAGKAPAVAMMQAPLEQALTDPSKLVRRAAAWSLRQILNDGYELPGLLHAMNSPNDRARRGATRVFAQYFYFAVQQPEYLRALLQHVSDPDLLVRIQSTKAVWRWYYRTQDPALRVSILDTLLGQMAKERSPEEQLNLSQALYNVMDDNIGLMYTYWLPTMGEESDREIAHEGHFRHEILLASKISAGLEHGDELEKRAILRAMGDYFLRARIGNDLDFVTFYNPDAADMLVDPLMKLLHDPSKGVREEAIKAAVAARNARDVRIKVALLNAVIDPDPAIREDAERAVPWFPTVASPQILLQRGAERRSLFPRIAVDASLGRPVIPRRCPIDLLRTANDSDQYSPSASSLSQLSKEQLPLVLATLKKLLVSNRPEGRVTALEWLNRDPATQTDAMAQLVVKQAHGERDPKVLAKMIESLDWILSMQPEAFTILESAAKIPDPGVREAIINAFKDPKVAEDHRTPGLLVGILRQNLDNPETQQLALELFAISKRSRPTPLPTGLLENPEVLTEIAVIAKRGRPPEAVKAAEVLQKAYQSAGNNKDALASLVSKQAAARLAQLPPLPPTQKLATAIEPLDFAYFVARVQPILERERSGQTRCMDCHGVSTNLSRHHLVRPLPSGQYTESAARSNFASILSLVDFKDPEQSYILRKPLAQDAGGLEVHSGGKYWASKANPEYQTILAWINGAQLTSPTAADRKELARINPEPVKGRPGFKDFVAKVQPILDKKYGLSQGQSCESCHSHQREASGFHLIPPDDNSHYSEAKLYANYLATLEFVNESHVTESLLLDKPLNPQSARHSTVHSGGSVWLDTHDADYQALETWAESGKSSTLLGKR